MRHPIQNEDFDDGGTPRWRAHEAARVAAERARRRGIVGWWYRASYAEVFAVIYLGGVGVTLLICVGGFLAYYAISSLLGS